MQAFHAHGEAYSRIEADALKLALHGPEPKKQPTGDDGGDDEGDDDDEEAKMQVYRDMLDELGTHISLFQANERHLTKVFAT